MKKAINIILGALFLQSAFIFSVSAGDEKFTMSSFVPSAAGLFSTVDVREDLTVSGALNANGALNVANTIRFVNTFPNTTASCGNPNEIFLSDEGTVNVCRDLDNDGIVDNVENASPFTVDPLTSNVIFSTNPNYPNGYGIFLDFPAEQYLKINNASNFQVIGTYDASSTLDATGNRATLAFDGGLATLIVGRVTDDQFNPENLGTDNFLFGYNNATAAGNYMTVIGGEGLNTAEGSTNNTILGASLSRTLDNDITLLGGTRADAWGSGVIINAINSNAVVDIKTPNNGIDGATIAAKKTLIGPISSDGKLVGATNAEVEVHGSIAFAPTGDDADTFDFYYPLGAKEQSVVLGLKIDGATGNVSSRNFNADLITSAIRSSAGVYQVTFKANYFSTPTFVIATIRGNSPGEVATSVAGNAATIRTFNSSGTAADLNTTVMIITTLNTSNAADIGAVPATPFATTMDAAPMAAKPGPEYMYIER